MTAKRAIELALRFGESNGEEPSASDAAATETPYRSAATALGETPDPRIAPNRCVWKVTVDATYNGFPGPPPVFRRGSTPVTIAQPSSFSVIFDANSGFMFEILAGR